MTRILKMTMAVAVLTASTATAQTKPAAAVSPKPTEKTDVASKPPAEPAPLPTNIKIEVSITDQTGANPPAKKVVTMIASDRQSANVRSSASVPVKQTVFSGPVNAATIPAASYTYR